MISIRSHMKPNWKNDWEIPLDSWLGFWSYPWLSPYQPHFPWDPKALACTWGLRCCARRSRVSYSNSGQSSSRPGMSCRGRSIPLTLLQCIWAVATQCDKKIYWNSWWRNHSKLGKILYGTPDNHCNLYQIRLRSLGWLSAAADRGWWPVGVRF